jgi:hypothetical protein
VSVLVKQLHAKMRRKSLKNIAVNLEAFISGFRRNVDEICADLINLEAVWF